MRLKLLPGTKFKFTPHWPQIISSNITRTSIKTPTNISPVIVVQIDSHINKRVAKYLSLDDLRYLSIIKRHNKHRSTKNLKFSFHLKQNHSTHIPTKNCNLVALRVLQLSNLYWFRIITHRQLNWETLLTKHVLVIEQESTKAKIYSIKCPKILLTPSSSILTPPISSNSYQ